MTYCKAPWTSICYMPGGKYSPCCGYNGNYFNSPQEIIDYLGPMFKQGTAPRACLGACPADQPGWRSSYERFETDFTQSKIYYLDFRNNNLCNMKCRSCGPGFSTSWAQEVKEDEILRHQPLDLTLLDLSNCQEVYFAGGEPLLNPQHYEVLQHLIDNKINPRLLYSTNMSTLQYKQQHVWDYWQHFSSVNVNASIDAVGKYAEFVRTGTVWQDIQSNINWARTKPNLTLRFCPVITAINIWWLDELFEYFKEQITEDHQFQPVLTNGNLDISIIPLKYRPKLIQTLKNCPWDHVNIKRAIDILETQDTSAEHWKTFLLKQLAMDVKRNERWFNNLPIRDELYRWIVF